MGGQAMNNVIHVDNSGFFRKMMKIYLGELGIDAESFARGEDALDLIATGSISCVITGLELVDMSGEELIKRLFFAPEPVSIIVVTSNNDEARNRYLETMGVMAIIQKTGSWKEDLRKILT